MFIALSCSQNKETARANASLELEKALTSELDKVLDEGYIKGFGVAIVNMESTLYAKGFGWANLQEKKTYTVNTIQNIASISKTLIGISLLKAHEMGKVDLNDPINQYLPFEVKNPFFPNEEITVEQLATHTSSILDGDLYGETSYVLKDASEYERAKTLKSSEVFNLPESSQSLQAYLSAFLALDGNLYSVQNFMEARPGQYYEYSNVGATLAAYIIEVVTGSSYASFTQEHILKPLGMSSSGWSFDAVEMDNYTALYNLEGQEIPYYSLITYPDGGLITSIEDMGLYLRELIKGHSGNGTLLSNKNYQQIFSQILSEKNFAEKRDTDNPYDDEYNSGIFMGHTPNGSIGHMGGDPGTSTFLFFNPSSKTGRLLFVNTDLDAKGAEQFYKIWDILGKYEIKMNESVSR